MAKRRTRRKMNRKRTPKAMFNILDVAQSFILANAGTKFAFGTNLVPFLTEGWLTPQTASTNNSWEVSLAEMFNLVTGGSGGIDPAGYPNGLMDVLKRNIRSAEGKQALATKILTPVLFKAGKKITAPAIRSTNKLIRQAGLGTLVKV